MTMIARHIRNGKIRSTVKNIIKEYEKGNPPKSPFTKGGHKKKESPKLGK